MSDHDTDREIREAAEDLLVEGLGFAWTDQIDLDPTVAFAKSQRAAALRDFAVDFWRNTNLPTNVSMMVEQAALTKANEIDPGKT